MASKSGHENSHLQPCVMYNNNFFGYRWSFHSNVSFVRIWRCCNLWSETPYRIVYHHIIRRSIAVWEWADWPVNGTAMLHAINFDTHVAYTVATERCCEASRKMLLPYKQWTRHKNCWCWTQTTHRFVFTLFSRADKCRLQSVDCANNLNNQFTAIVQVDGLWTLVEQCYSNMYCVLYVNV